MLRLLDEEEITPSEIEDEINDSSNEYNDDEIDEIINDLADDVLSESRETYLECALMEYMDDTLLEDGELDLEQEDLNEDFIFKLPNGRKYFKIHDFQGSQVLIPFLGRTDDEKEENANNKDIESIVMDFIQVIRKASMRINANCNGQYSKLMIHFSDIFPIMAYVYKPICDAMPSQDNSDSFYSDMEYRGYPLKNADQNKNESNVNKASKEKYEALEKSQILERDALYKDYLNACKKLKKFYESNRKNRELVNTMRWIVENGWFPIKELCYQLGFAYISDALKIDPLFRAIDNRNGLKNEAMPLFNPKLNLISQLERYKQSWRVEGRQALIESEELYDAEEIGSDVYSEI